MNVNTYNVVGEVVGLYQEPNTNNFNRTHITKMVIKDKTGDMYRGVRPATIKADIGDQITFTAEVRDSIGTGMNSFVFSNARNAMVLKS